MSRSYRVPKVPVGYPLGYPLGYPQGTRINALTGGKGPFRGPVNDALLTGKAGQKGASDAEYGKRALNREALTRTSIVRVRQNPHYGVP